jgi:hypothetical protein
MLKVNHSSTEDKDRGRKLLLKQLDLMDGAHADVGLFHDVKDGAADYGELSVAQIGAVHEFGSENIPERSWLRSNHDARIGKYNERLDRLYSRILQGKATVVASLTGFAEQVAGDVRRNITKIRTPPNAPATVAKKGSSNPLIDTGTMRNSVRGRVLVHGTRVGK